MNVSMDDQDVTIDTEGKAVPHVYVNGIRYSANGSPVMIYRAVKDSDGDYWIEMDPGTSGRHWHLMKLDSLRKDTLGDLAEKHGPLDTE